MLEEQLAKTRATLAEVQKKRQQIQAPMVAMASQGIRCTRYEMAGHGSMSRSRLSVHHIATVTRLPWHNTAWHRDALAVVLVVLSTQAIAQQPSTQSNLADQPMSVLSNGYITCGEFLNDNEASQAGGDTEWVLGYITGRNRDAALGSRYAGSSFTAPASVTVWLQNYCRTHALDRLFQAADSLRAEFLRRETR